jgi:FMN phosphatase YigB (HAD superfamily)
MPALDAILFDLGGTLDGRGDWRTRFHRLFAACGTHDQRAAAFDRAHARGLATPEMATARLRDMLGRHVGWQCEALGVADPALERDLVDRFVREVGAAAVVNRGVLAGLVDQGFRLGVVSNGCGNAALLCEEYGYSPLLSVVVDSHCVGASKPDPAIFQYALDALGIDPARTGFVGDSLDRDIAPAKALGMRTFWVANSRQALPPPAADVALDTVADLPASLMQFA